MYKNILLILLVLSILLVSCKKEKFEESNTVNWSTSLDTATNHFIDSTFAERSTFINGKVKSMISFVTLLNNYKKKDTAISNESLSFFADSLSKSLNIDRSIKPYKVLDKDYIDKRRIYHNNKLAYKAFMESSWKNSVTYTDFKEYVLPYKITNEIYDNWRDTLYDFHQKLVAKNPNLKNIDSLYNYHLTTTYNSLFFSKEKVSFAPIVENYSWINMINEGDCVARVRYTIYHLRAAGAPATFDYIAGWGNRPYAIHAYVGLATKKEPTKIIIKNNNDPTNLLDNLNAAMDPKATYVFLEKDLPKGVYIQYDKTIPKIYRETWLNQPLIYKLFSTIPHEELYPGLIKPNMADVTAKYLEVADVEITKSFFQRKSIAYLGTFDVKGWKPVAYATFDFFGKAVFKDLGKNILYMPMFYDGELTSFQSPFILDKSGIKRDIVCNKNKLINMKLVRKYPLFSYSAMNSYDFRGSVIEGANTSDFKNKEVLQNINYFPFGMQNIDLKKPLSARYIRFNAPKGFTIRIAELEFYQDSCGVLKKLEDVSYKKGVLDEDKSNVFDGDRSTYSKTASVELDFGKVKPISRIRFYPRSDLNSIIEGNEYELFYWDNDWISAGKKVATQKFLNFSNIPSGTIYWLKCLTEGKEERVFTYENNKQIWW
jgi:hypothetical protein